MTLRWSVAAALVCLLVCVSQQNGAVFIDEITGYNQELVTIPTWAALYIDSVLFSTGRIQSTGHAQFGINSPLGPINFATTNGAPININSGSGPLSINTPNAGGITLSSTQSTSVLSSSVSIEGENGGLLQSNSDPLILMSIVQPLSFGSKLDTQVSGVDGVSITSQFAGVSIESALLTTFSSSNINFQSGASNSQLVALSSGGNTQFRAAQLLQVLAGGDLSVTAPTLDVASGAEDVLLEVASLLTIVSPTGSVELKAVSSMLMDSLIGDYDVSSQTLVDFDSDTTLVLAFGQINLLADQLLPFASNDVNFASSGFLAIVTSQTFTASEDIVLKQQSQGDLSNSVFVDTFDAVAGLINVHTLPGGDISINGAVRLTSSAANVLMTTATFFTETDSTSLSATSSIEFIGNSPSTFSSTSTTTDTLSSPTINFNANQTLTAAFTTINFNDFTGTQTHTFSAQDQLTLTTASSGNKFPVTASTAFTATAGDRITLASTGIVSLSSAATLTSTTAELNFYSSAAGLLTASNTITLSNVNGQFITDSSGAIVIGAPVNSRTDNWHSTTVQSTIGDTSIGSSSTTAQINASQVRSSVATNTLLNSNVASLRAGRNAIISANGILSIDSNSGVVSLSSGSYISLNSNNDLQNGNALPGQRLSFIQSIHLSSNNQIYFAKSALVLSSAGDVSATSGSSISVGANTIGVNQDGWSNLQLSAADDILFTSSASLSITGGAIGFSVSGPATFSAADDFRILSGFPFVLTDSNRYLNGKGINMNAAKVTVTSGVSILVESTNLNSDFGYNRFSTTGLISVFGNSSVTLTADQTLKINSLNDVVFVSASNVTNLARPITFTGANKLQILNDVAVLELNGGGIQLSAEQGTIALNAVGNVLLTTANQHQIVTESYSTVGVGDRPIFSSVNIDMVQEVCNGDLNVQADFFGLLTSASIVFQPASYNGVSCNFGSQPTQRFEVVSKDFLLEYSQSFINAVNNVAIGGGYTQLLTAGQQQYVGERGISIVSMPNPVTRVPPSPLSPNDQDAIFDGYNTNQNMEVFAGRSIYLKAQGVAADPFTSNTGLSINARQARFLVTIDNGGIQQKALGDIKLGTTQLDSTPSTQNFTINASRNIILSAIEGAIESTAADDIRTVSGVGVRLFALAQNSSISIAAQKAGVYFKSFGDIAITSQLNNISVSAFSSLSLVDTSAKGIVFNGPNGISIGAPLGDVVMISGSSDITDADLLLQSSSGLSITSSNRQVWHSFGPTSGQNNAGISIVAVTSAIGVTASAGTINITSDGYSSFTALNGLWTATAQSGDLNLLSTSGQITGDAIGDSQLVTGGNLWIQARGGGGLVSIITGSNQAMLVQSQNSFVSLAVIRNTTLEAEQRFSALASGGNITIENTNSQSRSINIQSVGSINARTSSSSSTSNVNSVSATGEHIKLSAGNDINAEASTSITVGPLGSDSRLPSLASTNPLILINTGGDESIIGTQFNSVGDIQLLQSLSSGAAGLFATGNTISAQGASGITVNSQGPMTFNNTGGLGTSSVDPTVEVGRLTFDVNNGILTAHGLNSLIMSGINALQYQALNSITLNALGTDTSNFMVISSSRDLQITAEQRGSGVFGSTGTNGQYLLQANGDIDVTSNLVEITSVGQISIAANSNGRGTLVFNSDASTYFQATNTLVVSNLRNGGVSTFVTREESSDLRILTDDSQFQAPISISSGDSIRMASQTLRADGLRGLTYTVTAGNFDLVSSGSTNIDSEQIVQISTFGQLSFASGGNAYGQFNPVVMSASGTITGVSENGVFFDTPQPESGLSINVNADRNLNLISLSDTSRILITTKNQLTLGSVTGSLNQVAVANIAVQSNYNDIQSTQGSLTLKSTGLNAPLSVASSTSVQLNAGIQATIQSTAATADVNLRATDDITWTVAQPLQRHFMIVADSPVVRADVNITSDATTLLARTAINSNTNGATLVSSLGDTTTIITRHGAGDVVFEAPSASVLLNPAGPFTMTANPAAGNNDFNQLRTGTVSWESRGQTTATTTASAVGQILLTSTGGSVNLNAGQSIVMSSTSTQFTTNLVKFSSSGQRTTDRASIALTASTLLNAEALNSLTANTGNGLVILQGAIGNAITSQNLLGTATGQVIFRSALGVRPLDPQSSTYGVGFVASSSFAAVSRRANVTTTAQFETFVSAPQVTTFTNQLNFAGTTLIESTGAVDFLADHFSILNYNTITIDSIGYSVVDSSKASTVNDISIFGSLDITITTSNITIGPGNVDFQMSDTNNNQQPTAFVNMLQLEFDADITAFPAATLEFDYFNYQSSGGFFTTVYSEASDNVQGCIEREFLIDPVSFSICVCTRYQWDCRLTDHNTPNGNYPSPFFSPSTTGFTGTFAMTLSTPISISGATYAQFSVDYVNGPCAALSSGGATIRYTFTLAPINAAAAGAPSLPPSVQMTTTFDENADPLIYNNPFYYITSVEYLLSNNNPGNCEFRIAVQVFSGPRLLVNQV